MKYNGENQAKFDDFLHSSA